MTEPPVLIETSGSLGRITLNRPRAINALSHEMVGMIHSTLRDWQVDDSIATVLLDGAGDRGFCAGGDVRAVYDDAVSGGSASARYWADEYRLNAAIAEYPKPVVALMDGFVMGGGVGLAGHASHRIVNETSVVSMPEVTIGFSPDVGGTYLLARAPGELGIHLALTSARMNAGDAIGCGFADVCVGLDRRAELVEALRSGEPADVAGRLCCDPPAGTLEADRPWIDECYSAATVEQILARLHADRRAGAAAAAIERLSPTALKVTLRAVRLAAGDVSVRASLARELRVSVRCLTSHDLIEGVRAQLVDKDRDPRWQPASLADVTDADVDRFFQSLGAEELALP